MMVLLASQSPSYCERWRKALKGDFVLHEVGTKRNLVATLREFKPAVMVLDYDSKQFGKLNFITEITQHSPDTRIIALTNHPAVSVAVSVIAAGAKGYYSKGLSASLLKKAVQVVADGELWIGRKHVSALIEELIELNNRDQRTVKSSSPQKSEEACPGINELSQRQSEIVTLVATGKPNKLISDALNISERTVKAHLTEIFKRLGVTGRTELAINVCRSPGLAPCIGVRISRGASGRSEVKG